MDSFNTCTPPKHEEEDDESDIDLSMFDSEDDEFSDLDDCCHHIENVNRNIQMFSIFITSLIIINHDQIQLLEEMVAKVESDNKILMQLINHHKKAAKATKKTMSTNINFIYY
jgi:hypothetical protein